MNADCKLLKLGKVLLGLALLLFLSIPLKASARDTSNLTDWYIKDFQSQITVNTDSSLLITEKIVADCGNLPGKHGIFRTLPTYYQESSSQKVSTPIELISITDFAGHQIKYAESKNIADKTITWKIGDPNATVTGENNYQISYRVKNTIRFVNPAFDEFYWNLNGNFWQIETDQFTAKITFPSNIDQINTKEINLYSGTMGQNTNPKATYQWLNPNTLIVTSNSTLLPQEGITLSTTFPKGIISPYKPTFGEQYGSYLFLLIPLLVFLVCFRLWRKFGRDFKPGRPIMAEYDVPANLAPLEFGTLYQNGRLASQVISAAIIQLAVAKQLKIEQIEKKSLLGQADFILTKLPSNRDLIDSEQKLMAALFAGNESVKLSDLKNKFYRQIPLLRNEALSSLEKADLFDSKGFTYQISMSVIGVIFIAGSFIFLNTNPLLMLSILVSGIIVILFACLMPRRTQKGAGVYWQIQGFKLFISMTEKYRQQFNEKENIFEKFLPYAMIFGLTKIWINNIKKIYGEEYFNTYHPYWFYGPAFTNFNADSFNDMVKDLSDNMNSAISSNPSSSGAGGGGFSGGGGGGGGGGGW